MSSQQLQVSQLAQKQVAITKGEQINNTSSTKTPLVKGKVPLINMGKASSHIFGISSSSGYSQVQNNAIGVSRDQAVNQGIQKRTVDQLAEKQEGNLIFDHNQRSRGTVVQQSTGLIGVSKQPIIQMQKEDGKAHYSQIQKINDSAGESSKIQLSKHSSSKTLPIENNSMDQNRPSAKQYKYWIDVRDLQTILQFTLSNFQQAPLSSTEIWDPDSSCSQSIIKDDSCTPYSSVIGQDFMDYNLRLIKLIVEHDREIEQLFRRFVNTFNQGQLQKGKPLLNIDQILNFQGPKSLKRIYMIENAKIVTQVYQSKMREDIVNGLNMLLTRLNEYQARYQSKVLRLCFSSQKELYQIFIKVFGRDPFSVQTIRKIFAEIYDACLSFRGKEQPQQSDEITKICSYIYLKIEIFSRGRDLFDPLKNEYPLHKAVFENNLPLISRLVNGKQDGIFYQEKNEIDPCGHTPLILAVKLLHVDTIKVLCDLFTCPKLKSLHNFPCPIDVASSIKHKEIIKILLEANQKIKQHYLDLHKDAMFKALETLPDFKMDMHFSCKSNFIPFLSNITPSDTYRIYKKGSMLRLDMTLVGFRHLKCIRGNLSVLFKGRGQQNEGELYVVDHDSKTVSNIFSNVVYAKLDKDLEDIMNDQQYQKLYKADKFQMEPEMDKRRKGEIVSKQIEGYKAEKYNLRTTFTMTKYKLSINEMQSIQKHKSFEEYLQNNSLFATQSEYLLPQNDDEDLPYSIIADKNSFNATTPNPLSQLFTSQNHDDQSIKAGGQVHSQINRTNPNDPSQPLNTIMGISTKNKKTSKKTINASIWLCKSQHPLSLESFLPLLQVLSFSSKQIAKLKDYLMKYELPPNSFPLKAKIPIFFTMKAAFALRNLCLDPKQIPDSLFTIDEDYMQMQIKKNRNFLILDQQISSLGNLASQRSGVVAANLDELYKLVKTNEDFERDEVSAIMQDMNNFNDEDDRDERESILHDNERYSSMLLKDNQPEDLLQQQQDAQQNQVLSSSMSFHSEQDSVDLSERHLNDEQFKVATHSFSQIQTMNQINGRHVDDENQQTRVSLRGGPQNFTEARSFQHNQIIILKKHNIAPLPRPPQSYLSNVSAGSNTLDGENLFDSRIINEKHQVNQTATKRVFPSKPPIKSPNLKSIQNQQVNQKPNLQYRDGTSTIKKQQYLRRDIKNIKNKIKYDKEYNPVSDQEQSFAQKSEGVQSSQINHRSTADNSIITTNGNKNNPLNEKESLGSNWFKQILNYKNLILGENRKEGTGYLQTIESEEVMQTEGCGQIEIYSNVGGSSKLQGKQSMNQSSIISNFKNDDSASRQSAYQALQQARENIKNDSSMNVQPTHSDHGARQSMTREEKKALVNPSQLINRFHDFVVTNQIPIAQTPVRSSGQQSLSPSSKLGPTGSINQSFEQQKGHKSIDCDSQQKLSLSKIINYSGLDQKQLLPPKMGHKRQSSFGGGSSSNASQQIAFNNNSTPVQQNPQIVSGTGSGGIFNKIFGKSLGQLENQSRHVAITAMQNGRVNSIQHAKGVLQSQFTHGSQYTLTPSQPPVSSRQEAQASYKPLIISHSQQSVPLQRSLGINLSHSQYHPAQSRVQLTKVSTQNATDIMLKNAVASNLSLNELIAKSSGTQYQQQSRGSQIVLSRLPSNGSQQPKTLAKIGSSHTLQGSMKRTSDADISLSYQV